MLLKLTFFLSVFNVFHLQVGDEDLIFNYVDYQTFGNFSNYFDYGSGGGSGSGSGYGSGYAHGSSYVLLQFSIFL